MHIRKKNNIASRAYAVLMGWLVFTTLVFPPVVLTRSLLQPDYRWSFAGFSGTGMSGDWWFPVIAMGFVGVMMWCGWRMPRMMFSLLAVLWVGAQSLLLVLGLIEHGEAMRFRGDTLGIDIWFGWFVPVFVLFTALAIGWSVHQWRHGARHYHTRWTFRNTLGAMIAVILWLIAAYLFRSGELHGPTDVAGVLCIFLFWLVLNLLAFRQRGGIHQASTE